MRVIFFLKYALQRFPKLIILYSLFIVISGICDAFAIFTLAPIIDIVLHPDLQGISSITKWVAKVMIDLNLPVTLFSVATVFFGFNVLRGGVQIISVHFQSRIRMAVSANLIVGNFKHFMEARWSFFSGQKQGMLINSFTREIGVASSAFASLGRMFAGIVQGICFLVVPICISWQVTLASVGAALLLAAPFLLLGKPAYRLGQQTTATANELTIVIQEGLSLAKVILGFAKQHKHVQALREAFDRHRKAAVRSLTLQYAQPAAYQPLGVAVLVFGLYIARKTNLPFSELTVIFYALLRILPMVGHFVNDKSILENSFPAYEQINDLARQALELRQTSGKRAFTGFKQAVVVEHVSFAYPGHPPCIQEINMMIPKGKMVAIVGKSGAGKSTLIDIIMMFSEPLDGQIYVDGVPLHEFDINSYRKHIGYVPQDSILFNMSIADNLLWANEAATNEDIKEACQQANAHEFIEKFPEGYDTLVGDRGVRLSGGQLQRIALARAILVKPALLILDEATSSLDTNSERLIQQAIDKIAKQTTVIVIAHRLSTIANADYVYALRRGRVVEEGAYSDLVAKNGYFNRMVELQTMKQPNPSENNNILS